MNKNPCCGKCNRFNSSNLSLSVPVGSYYCINPSCECHAVKEVYMQGGSSVSIKSDLSFEEDQSKNKLCGNCHKDHEGRSYCQLEDQSTDTNEWRKIFLTLARKLNLREETVSGFDEQSAVMNFVASEKQKSYAEGRLEGNLQEMKAVKESRAALLAEVLAEMPKKKDTTNPSNDLTGNPFEWNISRTGFNGALSQVRALLESKKV